MIRSRNDVLQGTLTLLVLKALSNGPKHGYAITQHLQRASNELLRVEEGSLYPALHRMEQSKWVRSEWKLSETNRRARFYSLTSAGASQLAEEQKYWENLTQAVRQVLKFA